MSQAMGIDTKVNQIWSLPAQYFQPDGSHTSTLGFKYHKDFITYII